MDENEKRIRLKLKNDLIHYAFKCLKIRSKSGAITPFTLNRAQQYIHEKLEGQLQATGKVRALILKGRQQGCSTYIGARFYHKVTHARGLQAFILTHALDATNNLFKMAKRFFEYTPIIVRPEVSTSNSKELVFGMLDSGYKLGTAENKNVGRSATIQLLHASECGFWNNAADHAVGIMQAVPNSDSTEIIMESTANGIGNYFHQQWQQAEANLSDFIAIFVPWFWQDEYKREVSDEFSLTADEEELRRTYGLTKEQLMWRRLKIIELSVNGQNGLKSFQQEYPCVVAGERVGTSHGIIPIETTKSGDITNCGIINKQWLSGEKDTIIVTTSLGYQLKCTHDHRLSLFENNNFIEAALSLNKIISLSAPMLAEDLYSFSWKTFPCVMSSIVIDEDFALFLGFFMGDGSYHGDTLSIAFNKNDELSIQTVKSLINKIFGVNILGRNTSKNGYELRVGMRSVKKMFFELGIITEEGCRVKRKICVPDCIWKSPKHVVKQFLRGLFDSDGFAATFSANVRFFTKHTQFAIDVQLLLLSFKITCKRNHVQKKSGGGHFYMGNELCLRASEARKFGEEIGFVCKKKNDRVDVWLQPGKIGRSAKKISLKDNVVNITPNGVCKVYDIEMQQEPHVFDASGFLVHNCNANEAFQLTGEDSFISSDIVMRARKFKAEKYGPLLIGVDPARFGDDRTSIIRRQGRCAFELSSYSKKDTMEVVGIVKTIIDKEKPAKVFVDVGGLGAGVVDRLRELVDSNLIVAVNSGSSPFDARKYYNKRSEVWALCKEWLEDSGGVQIPDCDSLHADLCGIKYRVDSNSRLVMEQKAEMKKRGIRSPDEADALMLTFALPDSAFSKEKNKILNALSTTFEKQMNARNYLYQGK